MYGLEFVFNCVITVNAEPRKAKAFSFKCRDWLPDIFFLGVDGANRKAFKLECLSFKSKHTNGSFSI